MSLVKQLDTFKKRLNANSSLGIVESSKKRSSDIDSDKPKSKKPKTDSHRGSKIFLIHFQNFALVYFIFISVL